MSIFLVELLLLLIHVAVLSTGSGSAPTLVPPVLRGLTELFLVVENLAQVSIYWLLTGSRWLGIGQVFSWKFMDRDGVEVHKHAKKEQHILANKLDQ